MMQAVNVFDFTQCKTPSSRHPQPPGIHRQFMAPPSFCPLLFAALQRPPLCVDVEAVRDAVPLVFNPMLNQSLFDDAAALS